MGKKERKAAATTRIQYIAYIYSLSDKEEYIRQTRTNERQGTQRHARRQTKEDSGGTVIYSERRRSSFSRRFALPDDADESSIHAKQKDGVVTISIGKAAPSAPRIRHIPVSSLADGSGVPPSPHADAAGAAGPGETPQQHDGDTAHADA